MFTLCNVNVLHIAFRYKSILGFHNEIHPVHCSSCLRTFIRTTKERQENNYTNIRSNIIYLNE